MMVTSVSNRFGFAIAILGQKWYLICLFGAMSSFFVLFGAEVSAGSSVFRLGRDVLPHRFLLARDSCMAHDLCKDSKLGSL